MATTTLGKVAVTPKGAWSNSTAYEVLDIVTNSGSAYMAKQAVPAGTALSNTSYWILLVEKGDKGDTGEITGASASISGGYGTPGVSVTAGGTSTERSFSFAFSNLVGNGIASIMMAKTGTSGNVDTYTLTVTTDDGNSEALEIEVTNGAVTSVNGRTGAVTGLAEADGTYPELTSGQMLSDNYAEDQVPYNFRRSGGGVEVGTVEKECVVGGTVAWTQHCANGNFASKSRWSYWNADYAVSNNEATITSSATAGSVFQDFSCLGGHKYLVSASLKNGTATKIELLFGGSKNGETTATDKYTRISTIYANSATQTRRFQITATGSSGQTAYVKDCQLFDLTQLFGSTIADYVYALESNTAGSGVAKLKEWGFFLKDYYAYDAGSLQSVNTSSHDMVGFNQWDEEWELGGLNSATGATWQATDRIRCKNYIPVIPNTTYFINRNFATCCGYDANEVFTGAVPYRSADNGAFYLDVPSGTHYIKFAMTTAYGTTYKHDICINLSDPALNGTYEPYVKHSYALDSDLTLRGILKLDASNRLYYDGDTYEADGTVTRRYGIVDLGTLTWSYSSERDWFSVQIGDIKPAPYNSVAVNAVCPKYITVDNTYMRDTVPTFIGLSVNNARYVVIRDTTYSDAATFKTAMNGVYLVYELATPTTEAADPYALYQAVDEYGTEAYVDYAESQGTRDVAIPVGHQTLYYENARKKLSQLPKNFSTLIAPTESTYTATRNYTTNALFIVNNILYKATANIANGGTITPNTNCTATTLAEIIAEL